MEPKDQPGSYEIIPVSLTSEKTFNYNFSVSTIFIPKYLTNNMLSTSKAEELWKYS